MQQVYGIPLVVLSLCPSQPFAALFTSGYFDEYARPFLSTQYALLFIFPSIKTHSKTLFVSTCLNQLGLYCQIVFTIPVRIQILWKFC